MTIQHAQPTPPKPDLTACDREPIHIPGHIQPHGALIATFPDSMRISHVSENFEDSVGLPAAQALNAELGDLLGSDLAAAVKTSLASGSYTPSNILNLDLPIPRNPNRNVVAHRHLGRTIIELEMPPLRQDQESSLAQAQMIITSLHRSETVSQLCTVATRELRQLTGFDRVMIYRFDADGHGTVIAEDRRDDLEPFLDLHYPASDIPQQARRLYVLQRVRSIPDVHYAPVRVLAAPDAGASTELDMSFCALRGVSPVHLEYMRNMDVRATMAVSLVKETALWGMIVCHHTAPLAQSADTRSFCDLIGQLTSMLLQKVEDADFLAERLRRYQSIAMLRNEMENAENIARTLARHSSAMLELVGASGALVRIGDDTMLLGQTPDQPQAASILNTLRQFHSEEIVGISDAGRPGEVAADAADTASGILLMPILNNPQDAIAWLRPETVRTVNWGGNPTKSAAQVADNGMISPRKSFAKWSEQVRGRADPWSAIDLQTAHELRRTITGALLRQAEVRLAQLSAYDPLTSLANRRTLKSYLEACRTDGFHPISSMLFFDLDRFKLINDSLGHGAGDQVLIQVAARLRQFIPAGAMAVRLGGDEFVVFWPGASQVDAELLAGTLIRELSAPLMVQDQLHYVTVSIGIACSDPAGLDQLLREADEAMYAAKREGGGKVVVFQPSHHTKVLTANQIQQDLFRAVESDGLEIHYQPIVGCPDRVITGFEALVRWRHAIRGWISPAEFIPRAEETGLIGRIGSWVFASAVNQLALWQRIDSGLTMSINVSARQLMDGAFSAYVASVLANEQVQARTICLEVTESALMHETAVRELHRLRAMGVRVAVDDFGTGYSSLAYLQSLPVDVVKIDRSFVARLGSNSRADRFFSAILALGHTLDLKSVAEGCETEEQWSIIEAAGCDLVQGWLISPAIPPARIDPLLLAEKPVPTANLAPAG